MAGGGGNELGAAEALARGTVISEQRLAPEAGCCVARLTGSPSAADANSALQIALHSASNLERTQVEWTIAEAHGPQLDQPALATPPSRAAAMALLTPACLVVVCMFVILHRGDRLFHWMHRCLFSGLHFYLPPSDQTIRTPLPRGAMLSHLSSKARKRLAKRAGLAAGSLGPTAATGSESVDLTLVAISPNMFIAAGSNSFVQLHTYISVHLALIALVLVEQTWVCANTHNTIKVRSVGAEANVGLWLAACR